MSFETFDFHIGQKNWAGAFVTSEEEQRAEGRFQNKGTYAANRCGSVCF